MANFEDIRKANETIATTNIKGKEYAEVNQRIKAFRMVYPEGSIITDLVQLENGICTIKAVIKNGELVLGTGIAQEKESSSYINKTSYIENCETSAVGRALGISYKRRSGKSVGGEKMTVEEAITILKIAKTEVEWDYPLDYAIAIDTAIEALEKQIPKKPIKSDREVRYYEVWKCPKCGFEWSSRVVDYCYKCGQAIDWRDEE